MTGKSPRKPPGKDDPRRQSTTGYAEEQLRPKEKGRKLPGEGGPREPHNNPKQKPGRGGRVAARGHIAKTRESSVV